MLAMPGTHPGIVMLRVTPTLVHCSRCWKPTEGERFDTVDGPRRAVAVKEPRRVLREYCGQCAYETGYLIHVEG